jgi:Glycosyltransferases involved in cell wall biogenesis
MKELVSIIMPSYNTGAYIAQTIRSVQRQTYENWELIIVDDCSTDNSAETVQPFLADRRIRFYHNAENRGAAQTRNRALRLARGRWIAFLDSDDLWEADKLRRQVRFMEERRCSFSYTKYAEIDSDGTPLHRVVSGPRRITRTGFYNYCWPGCLTVMYDARAVGLIQIAELEKNNDYAMWLKVCEKADCYLLDECLAQYRRGRVGSVSTCRLFTMIGWHYRLFRVGERQSVPEALFNTGRNMAFGLYKKIRYVKRA